MSALRFSVVCDGCGLGGCFRGRRIPVKISRMKVLLCFSLMYLSIALPAMIYRILLKGSLRECALSRLWWRFRGLGVMSCTISREILLFRGIARLSPIVGYSQDCNSMKWWMHAQQLLYGVYFSITIRSMHRVKSVHTF